MILRSAAASPFARKVRIVADILGLSSQIAIVDADTASPIDSLRRENPLGKIPTLILDDAQTLFDSSVIVAYLDHLAGGGLIPVDPARRFPALKLEALADGICEAAVLLVYESRWRDPAMQEPRWIDHQGGKIARSLDLLEAELPEADLDVGHVALACALGYLDLRFAGEWRATHPRLVAWLDGFATRVPAFEATRFKG